MESDLKIRANQILLHALELPVAARSGYVQQACNGEQSLLELTTNLLAHLDEPTGATLPLFDEAQDPQIGRQLGAYQLQELIGVGGMGRVYRATRNDGTVQQTVAIKLVSDVADARARRWTQEWQILASLHHPNIAGFLDCGEEADSLAWLAMEFIDGVPIDDYCRELTLNARLRLFQQVCAAVRYAHQNLVVHRDLKPGNILVTAEGTPKLLDFGIAKLLDPEHSDNTLDPEKRRMTPCYASPEQLLGQPVATPSDVYSLGVILYELLTDKSPYQDETEYGQVVARITAGKEPDKPSVTIEMSEETVAAETRMTQKLLRQLRGDVDNIVLKALRYEANERYSSVEQLAEDIQRYLEGLPVLAAKDTRRYRLMKFARRRRVEVAIAAAAILSLMAATTVALWQARRANEQAAVAQRERDNARRINDFFGSIFTYANPEFGEPGHGKGADIKLVDAIRGIGKRIDDQFKDQPEIRNDLHHTLGQALWLRGDHQSAEPHFRAAMELSRQLHNDHHPRAIQNFYKLGLMVDRNGDQAAAITIIEQAVEMMRESEPENGALPYMLLDLGNLLSYGERSSEAEAMILEARERFRKKAGSREDYQVVNISCWLGKLYLRRGELERAETSFQAFLDRLSQLPNIKHEAGDALYHLGVIRYTQGNYQEAEKFLVEADSLFSQYLEGHPQIADFLYYLASIHCLQGDYTRAEAEARRALEIIQQKFSPEHRRVSLPLGLLSKILIQAKRPSLAAQPLRDAIAIYQNSANSSGGKSSRAAGILGECLTLLKRYDEAERFLKESCTGLDCEGSRTSPEAVEARQRLDKLYAAWGKKTRAY